MFESVCVCACVYVHACMCAFLRICECVHNVHYVLVFSRPNSQQKECMCNCVLFVCVCVFAHACMCMHACVHFRAFVSVSAVRSTFWCLRN